VTVDNLTRDNVSMLYVAERLLCAVRSLYSSVEVLCADFPSIAMKVHYVGF